MDELSMFVEGGSRSETDEVTLLLLMTFSRYITFFHSLPSRGGAERSEAEG